MKKLSKLLITALFMPLLLGAQEKEKEDSPKYSAVEVLYIKPKVGMDQKIVEAIKEHNGKYHKDGPYGAGLYTVAVGEQAGWIIWVMGNFTYSELDNAPGEGEHMDHWRKKVDPYVAEYGRVEHWRFADKLSHRNGNNQSKPMEVVWFLDLEPFQNYRFQEFMKKVQKVYNKQDEDMEVWNNLYSGSNGRDAAIFWPLENWAALDKDDWKMSTVYEEEYGEGSWMNAMEEWKSFVSHLDQEVWRRLM